MATTRERILTLQQARIEEHVIAAILGIEEAEVSQVLSQPAYSPPNLTSGADNAGYVNAVTYGVSTVGDQTAKISAFFDYCNAQGKNAYFPKGVYECGQIIKKYGLNVLADPGAEIKVKAGTGGECWTFEGALGAALKLEAAAAAGTRILKLPTTAGRTKGEVLKIGTVTQVPNNGGAGGGTRFCGQLVEISKVINGTEVETRERLYRAFTNNAGADKTTVTPLVPIKGMEVTGLKFVNPNEANCRFLLVQLARDVDIEVETDGQLQSGIEVQDVYGFRVKSRSEHGQHDNVEKFGYGVFASAGSCHGQVDSVCANGNYAFNCSGVNNVPGEPYDITVSGICDNSTRNAWGTHPEGHHIYFNNCTALNPAESGVGISCPNVTVQGCSIIGTGTHGVETTTGASNGIRVSGNTFMEIGEVGVYLHTAVAMSDITVAENTFDGVGQQCVNSTGTINRLRQHNNTMKGHKSYAWRHQKALTDAIIADEQVDQTGAHEHISQIDVAAVTSLITRCVVKHASNAAKWSVVNAKETAEGIVEGVSLTANLINAP